MRTARHSPTKVWQRNQPNDSSSGGPRRPTTWRRPPVPVLGRSLQLEHDLPLRDRVQPGPDLAAPPDSGNFSVVQPHGAADHDQRRHQPATIIPARQRSAITRQPWSTTMIRKTWKRGISRPSRSPATPPPRTRISPFTSRARSRSPLQAPTPSISPATTAFNYRDLRATFYGLQQRDDLRQDDDLQRHSLRPRIRWA